MTRRDDRVSLRDMLSHSREAAALLGDSTREELSRNRTMQLALTRLVEIIGEAANRVSQATRQKAPQIPWPQIIGMRNRLIRGYDVIDFDLLYDTIRLDLPPLIAALQKIVQEP